VQLLNGKEETSPQPAKLPTPSEALSVYIASQGLVFLCLERLQAKYPSLDEVALYNLLSDPSIQNDLESKTRSQLVMRTFEAANEAIQLTRQSLPLMEPFERSKTATNLLAQLDVLTKKQQDINLNAIIWENLLPGEAAEAVKFLLASNKPNHDSTEHQRQNLILEHQPDSD